MAGSLSLRERGQAAPGLYLLPKQLLQQEGGDLGGARGGLRHAEENHRLQRTQNNKGTTYSYSARGQTERGARSKAHGPNASPSLGVEHSRGKTAFNRSPRKEAACLGAKLQEEWLRVVHWNSYINSDTTPGQTPSLEAPHFCEMGLVPVRLSHVTRSDSCSSIGPILHQACNKTLQQCLPSV